MSTGRTEVIVVGAGLSGLMAATLALEHGARVRLIGKGIGSLLVTPGWISVADQAPGDVLSGAWSISAASFDHPYALVGIETLGHALHAFQNLCTVLGLPYDGDLSANLRLPTALGAEQTPALAPRSLAAGSRQGETALYVGFEGWRDFYPRLAGPRAVLIPLPASTRAWDASPTDIARAFDDKSVRAAVIAAVRPHLNGAKAVGFPAVLGLDDPLTVQADLSNQVGVPVFEIPTLPPSVPGVRLFNRWRRHLLDNGVRIQIGHPVVRGLVEQGKARGVEVGAAGKAARFMADKVILATGGLYGGGLFSDDRGHIWEPLFGLPVESDSNRLNWFAETMLAPAGHPIQHVGVRVNAAMQPIGIEGSLIAENLYAIGHLLAQPGDTPPDSCHEGVALATAYKAVQSALGS